MNISNDGYFGHSAAREQHLEIARMRAAENRRWMLRVTNDGITAAIDPGESTWPMYRVFAMASQLTAASTYGVLELAGAQHSGYAVRNERTDIFYIG